MKLAIFLISAFPLLAFAEVMDKELSQTALLAWGVNGVIFSYLCARFKPWLLLPVIVVFGFVFISIIAEVTDPFVGPNIAHEAGSIYIITAWLSPISAIALIILGLVLRRRHAKNTYLSLNAAQLER